MLGHLPGEAPPELCQGRRVVGQVRVAPAPADGDRPQVLGAHHGAHAGPPVVVAQVVHKHRVADPVLPGPPDLQDANHPVVELVADRRLDGRRVLAPEVPGVADLGRAVLHPETDGVGRPAGDHDRVEAGHLQLRSPVAAGLGLAEAAGQRRAGDRVETGRRRDGRAGEQACREDQDVLRAERVAAGTELREEVVRGQRLAAGVSPVEALVEGVGGDRSGRQVDPQDRPVRPVAHRHAPSHPPNVDRSREEPTPRSRSERARVHCVSRRGAAHPAAGSRAGCPPVPDAWPPMPRSPAASPSRSRSRPCLPAASAWRTGRS